MGNCIATIFNIALGILNTILIVKNSSIQKKQSQFTALTTIYSQIQNSINTLFTETDKGNICIKGIFGLERLRKTINNESSIGYSKINILCSKLREIDANIKLFYKTNFESSIDKGNKFMFYQLIEPVTNQIILFYELVTNDQISIAAEGAEYTEGDEKTEEEYLQERVKKELEQLREFQKIYIIQQ
ncbi:hypothetical protein [Odoribacter lunatus]|uniref:hypothetical protein n=1 Tax=Odoribacter lunatus TaxID=2941335 RepID=UPI00203AA2AB|nr:hypothetical protein [Odoribacter lunatus]